MIHPNNTTLDRMIPEDEADALRFYLGTGAGMALRSNFGAVADRLGLYLGSRECPRCHGHGFIASAKASRVLDAEALWQLGLEPGTKLPPAFDRACPECNGLGVKGRESPERIPLHRVTVWPTGCSKSGRGSNPVDHEQLARMGGVRRRLDRLEQMNDRSADVLCAYWGPWGERLRGLPEGRLGAVYPMTPACRTLLRSEPTLDITHPVAALLGVLHAQQTQRKQRRADQLDASRAQAVTFYQEACWLWGKTAREASPKTGQEDEGARTVVRILKVVPA